MFDCFFAIWGYFEGLGPSPMDPDRHFLPGGGIYMPGARIWTPLVPKRVKSLISEPHGDPPWGSHGDPMGLRLDETLFFLSSVSSRRAPCLEHVSGSSGFTDRRCSSDPPFHTRRGPG